MNIRWILRKKFVFLFFCFFFRFAIHLRIQSISRKSLNLKKIQQISKSFFFIWFSCHRHGNGSPRINILRDQFEAWLLTQDSMHKMLVSCSDCVVLHNSWSAGHLLLEKSDMKSIPSIGAKTFKSSDVEQTLKLN